MRRLSGVLPLFPLLLSDPSRGEGIDFDWRLYSQLAIDSNNGETVEVDYDRLRVRSQINAAPFSAVVQLELAANDWDRRMPARTVNVIFDAYMDYAVNDRHRLRAGQFKTPMGLDFGLPPNVMEITKRGMEFGLIMNRATGVMLSGRRFGKGFGYDAGVFNLASQAFATDYEKSQQGDDFAWVMRGLYDGENWSAEVSHGESGNAGGPATADYRATDVGLVHERERAIYKFEWIEGRGVRGNATRTEQVYYFHAGYRIRDKFELVARHFEGSSRIDGSTTDLTNTYVGFTLNAFQDDIDNVEARFQLNYVFAGGDGASYTGIRGFRDDALLAQFQLLFAR